jgi:hypothetical protein
MSKKITSYQTAEFGKFEEIVGSSEYPPVSVTRISYPDTTNAFPSNSAVEPLSSIEIYPKYAVLTKLINPEDIKVSLSAQNINMNLDEIELNTDEIETLLNDLTASNRYVAGFSIPPYDEIAFEYVGSTDIFRTVNYLKNSTQVMSLSFTYVIEPPTSGNAIIQSVKKV